MSRSARWVRPGTLQFISCRFIDRAWTLTSELERAHFLTLFGRAMATSDWKCLAYCLMGDRVQYAMVAGDQRLDSWTKRVHSPFAHWQNKRRSRIGPIFAGRPTTREIAAEDALKLIAFVHNSPVRASFVARAADVSLSSHRAYLGDARRPRWLHITEGLRLAGFMDRPTEFDDAVNRLVQCALPDAPPDLEPVEFQLERVTAEQVLGAVAAAFRIPLTFLRGRHLRGNESAARRVAIHVARACRVSLAEMATALGVSRQRASRVASLELTPHEQSVTNEIVRLLRTEWDTSPIATPGPSAA
jgi:hypothetical protein